MSGAALWAALLLVTHLSLGLFEIFSTSQTYDEGVHLASGYALWKSGEYRVDAIITPPLSRLIAAFPLLWLAPDPMLGHPSYIRQDRFVYANEFLYENHVPPEKLLYAGRVFLFLLMAPLGAWMVFHWTTELSGGWAGLWALFFYALNPVVLANAPLVTPDLSFAVLSVLCLYFFSRALRRDSRNWLYFLVSGLFIGLALGTKHSALIMSAILPLAYGIHGCLLKEPFRPEKAIQDGLCVAAGALTGLILAYRPSQLALWWEGLHSALRIGLTGGGRASYLMGVIKAGGWWYYFPLAFLMKTPIPLILLATVGLWSLGRPHREADAAMFCSVILPAICWLGAAASLRFQIGIRHILPIYPLCCVIAGTAFSRLWQSGISWKRWAMALLAAWYALGVLKNHPNHLAYFNEIFGGPQRGYRLLADSNLDWGQELKAFGSFLEEEGGPPVYLSYFGTADPHLYRIRYVPVAFSCPFSRPGDPVEPCRARKVLFAVSATNRAYEGDLMEWLAAYQPYKVLGHSLFVYDFTRTPEALRHIARVLSMSGERKRADSLIRYLQTVGA